MRPRGRGEGGEQRSRRRIGERRTYTISWSIGRRRLAVVRPGRRRGSRSRSRRSNSTRPGRTSASSRRRCLCRCSSASSVQASGRRHTRRLHDAVVNSPSLARTSTADAPVGKFARLYIRRHHPAIAQQLTDRPVDPGARDPAGFPDVERVSPLFAETRAAAPRVRRAGTGQVGIRPLEPGRGRTCG